MDEYVRGLFVLLAYCGRYGRFSPPGSLGADLGFLRRYADAVAELARSEAEAAKPKGQGK